MRAISIFSIAFLTLSVWSLFFAVSHLKSENQLEVEVVSEVIEDIDQEASGNVKISTDKPEDSAELDEQEAVEIAVAIETTQPTELTAIIEEKPTSLISQASSRYNDILYDFEKDHPISVDDLLEVLILNH